jgi:hypothetical protein
VYDIIGDIHGHHDQLEALLRKLGYRESGGAWRHAGRQAIFVGDLIDRGPKQVETVTAVRRMVDAGTACCVQGNHEFNAVAWFTPDPANPGMYLRPHDAKNTAQHLAFLDQVGENSALHGELVDWFRQLPLWLDLGKIRVVHACWDEPSIEWLTPLARQDGSLTEGLYVDGSRRGHRAFEAIEALCKGLEVRLPEGVSFVDKGGVIRHEARVRWWAPELNRYRDAAIGPPDLIDSMPNLEFPADLKPKPYTGPPVFFGHYWFDGRPDVLADNIACLDYSVAKGGPLVAYRWEGEASLSSEQFVMTD